MKNNFLGRQREKIKNLCLLLLQRLWITFELFNRDGLMNHAAACAYGFLLSAAPALLFISFVVSRALFASPELAENLLGQIGLLFGIFDIENPIRNFLSSANFGLAGLFSVITIFWTARLCTLSVQRGFGVIFPGRRSALRDNIATLGLGLLAMFVIFIILFGLRLAVNFYDPSGPASAKFFAPIILNSARILLLLCLTLLTLVAYRFFPAAPQKGINIIFGVLVCIIFYRIFNMGFTLLISPDRYNLIYGALGRLFLFLVNVYFFFVFFFFGAQWIHVLGISDALLFARFRQVHEKRPPSKSLLDKLFAAPPAPLSKYMVFYKKDDIVFLLRSRGQEVYYILSGKAGVYLDNETQNRIAFIDEGHFFGEISSLASDTKTGRAATIKAETDLSVLALPLELFNVILRIDPNTDHNLITTLSKQLKSANNQIKATKKS